MYSNFVPSTRHNAVSMLDGATYMANLAELAAYMEAGGSITEPLNEVAHGTTRVFLEIDGALSDDLEDSMLHLLLRRGYELDADSAYKAVLRCGHVDGPRYHVVYPRIVMPVHEYRLLIKDLQSDYPHLDLTANDSKAWLRFPKTPKRGSNRRYHLVQGTYRDAFINPHDTPSRSVHSITVPLTGADQHRIYNTFRVTVSRKGYAEGGRRTYFSTGPCTCVCGTLHRKRPVTIHVTVDGCYKGRCNDPSCKYVGTL